MPVDRSRTALPTPISTALSCVPWLVALLMAMPTASLAQSKDGGPGLGLLIRDLNRPITGGYVMTHEHPAVGMAFGGNYAFTGAPGNYVGGVMEDGYTDLCDGCQGACDHGEFRGLISADFLGASDMGNHSPHLGPVHNSFSHIRYSTEWVREAFDPPQARFSDTRMKILVAYALENEALCEQIYYSNVGKGGPGGDGYPCSRGDSVVSLERQLDAIRAWVGRNSDWMEIAETAAEARRIVHSDKLAVVLGIEAEYAFGAEDRTFDPVARLARYYDQGVRTFYLSHKLNSRLSGADVYYPKFSGAGAAIRATQAISGCFYYDDRVGPFPLNAGVWNFCANNPRCGPDHFLGPSPFDNCNEKLSEISELNMAGYVIAGATTFNGFAIYPQPPGFDDPGGTTMVDGIERNNLGLSDDGERVVRDAMQRGMIINIDHVSSVARRQIYDISRDEFGLYPLNAFHNNALERLESSSSTKASEYELDATERFYIRRTGGIFGVRLGPIDAKPYAASGVSADCPDTSTETAQMLAFLIDEGMNLGYSLDLATITQGVHSRSFAGCDHRTDIDRLDRFGGVTTQGLSHIGMMKKWHRELEDVGLEERYLEVLKNDGAEAFVRMWERSEEQAAAHALAP